MADELQGVETTQSSAPETATGVETNASAAAPADDPEVKLKALLEENEKLRRDRDNYRSAALAMKGKKDVEDLDLSDPTQVQAYIEKSIEDRLLRERQAGSENAVTEYAKELARKNKELTLALQSKSAISGLAGGGGGSDHPAPNAKFFSPEQEAALKARWKQTGIPESKYDEMLKKVREQMVRGQ